MHRARSTTERGFTLAEVMVVVLIIGILLAIGIPTFVGARNRAHDTAAQASLDTAIGTAAIVSELGADYALATPSAMEDAEPTMTFLPAGQSSAGPEEVSVDSSASGNLTMTVRSNSGTCFAAEVSPQATNTYTSGSCTAAIAFDVNAAGPINLAPQATASMSSCWFDCRFPAENLNDGELDDPDYSHSARMGHTQTETNPWAAFDLPANATIESVAIWNRTTCCASRATNVWVFVSDDPIPTDLNDAKAGTAAAFNIPGQVGNPSTVAVGQTGQYVRVFIEATTALNLREIQIFGTMP